MIQTTEELKDLAARLRHAAWIGIDTEADSLHSYPEKLCLVQLAFPGDEVLVDPLADIHLEPLWEVFDGRELIFHAADYDLRLLAQGHHFVPKAIFDTMWAARLLGEQRFGLNDILTRFLGITLEKGAQKANWGRRPLTPRMVQYAINDVRHLRPLEGILRDKLREKGRLEWHEQTCARLISDSTHGGRSNPETEWRVKGHDKLNDTGLAVMREIWRWREQEALRTRIPPFFVLRHDKVHELAAHAAEHGLRGLRLPHQLTSRRQRELLEAVRAGLALPPTERPQHIRVAAKRMTRRELGYADVLRQRRDRHAEELGIDPTIIAAKATLFALAREGSNEWEQLLPWQRVLLEEKKTGNQPGAP